MTVPTAIYVEVFKTARRPGVFLFLPGGLRPSEWPVGMVEIFSPAEKVLSLTLTADKHLAAQSSAQVMKEIVSRGYFIQLPPHPSASADNMELSPC